MEAAGINRLRDLSYVADQLGYYEIYGDWQIINKFTEAVQKVKPEQVQAAAQQYFVSSNATIGMVKKPGK